MDTQPTLGCPYSSTAAGHRTLGQKAVPEDVADMLAEGPAVPVNLAGVPAWCAVDPDLVERLLRMDDDTISKDALQHWGDYKAGNIRADWPYQNWFLPRSALNFYGDQHRQARGVLLPAFSRARVESLVDGMRGIATELLDGLAPLGPELDLRAAYTWPYPLRVINLMLGVPPELHEGFREHVSELFDTTRSSEQAQATYAATYALLTELVAIKRRTPGHDMTSALIEAHDAEFPEDARTRQEADQELAGALLLLIGASHQTSSDLLGHLVVHLAGNSDQLAMIRAGQAEWADAVEESLRLTPPLANVLWRSAVQDVHDATTGFTFRRGEPIVMNFASTGLDPARHGPDVREFRIDRPTSEDHRAFGFGAHRCMGATLARREAEIAVSALFHRYPNLELAVAPQELELLPGWASYGYKALPVRPGEPNMHGAPS